MPLSSPLTSALDSPVSGWLTVAPGSPLTFLPGFQAVYAWLSGVPAHQLVADRMPAQGGQQLVSNPLAYSFVVPLSLTLLGIFAGSFLALCVAVRGRWAALRDTVLFQRWRTWLVIAPIFSLVVLSGSLALAVFASALALQGGREYAHLMRLSTADRALLYAAAVCLPLVCLLPVSLPLCLLVLVLLATLPALAAQDVEHGIDRVARLVVGVLYLPVSLSVLVLLALNDGSPLLLAIGLSVALSDVGAFTFGRLFGRRLLAARLSPSKTWAGVVGNVGGAGAGLALSTTFAPSVPALALTPVVALGSVWGDLLESLIKRTARAKDSGAWLPGFGGLLDRIDSLLLVLPLTYAVLRVARP